VKWEAAGGQSSLFAQAREQGLWLAVKPSEVRVEPRRCISLKIHQSHHHVPESSFILSFERRLARHGE
jgi:hypothetical protein